jgi:hypothetical protein
MGTYMCMCLYIFFQILLSSRFGLRGDFVGLISSSHHLGTKMGFFSSSLLAKFLKCPWIFLIIISLSLRAELHSHITPLTVLLPDIMGLRGTHKHAWFWFNQSPRDQQFRTPNLFFFFSFPFGCQNCGVHLRVGSVYICLYSLIHITRQNSTMYFEVIL